MLISILLSSFSSVLWKSEYMQYELRHDSADILLHFPLVTTRCRQSFHIALSEKAGATHLQLRIVKDHQVGAGVDVIPFDEGHVRASD